MNEGMAGDLQSYSMREPLFMSACMSVAQSNLLYNFYFPSLASDLIVIFSFIIPFINSLLYPNKMIKRNISDALLALTFSRRLFLCLFLVWGMAD